MGRGAPRLICPALRRRFIRLRACLLGRQSFGRCLMFHVKPWRAVNFFMRNCANGKSGTIL